MNFSSEEMAESLSQDGTFSRLSGGHMGCDLFRIRYSDQTAVIKFGRKGTTAELEVIGNLRGYDEMRQLGVADFVSPIIFTTTKNREGTFLIMEDAGIDLRNSITTDNCIDHIQTVINSLRRAYKSSLRSNRFSSLSWLGNIKTDLVRYFEEYIIPAGYVDVNSLDLIKRINLERLTTDNVAWATTDLTPDNIFVKNGKTIIIDPKPNVLGVPFIDLGMLSVLSNEVYMLPGSAQIRDRIADFIPEVSDILNVETKQSRDLFNFGKARQYSLSSRFRIGKDTRAKSFAESAIKKLEDLSL